jgi:hypothetical protein
LRKRSIVIPPTIYLSIYLSNFALSSFHGVSARDRPRTGAGSTMQRCPAARVPMPPFELYPTEALARTRPHVRAVLVRRLPRCQRSTPHVPQTHTQPRPLHQTHRSVGRWRLSPAPTPATNRSHVQGVDRRLQWQAEARHSNTVQRRRRGQGSPRHATPRGFSEAITTAYAYTPSLISRLRPVERLRQRRPDGRLRERCFRLQRVPGRTWASPLASGQGNAEPLPPQPQPHAG